MRRIFHNLVSLKEAKQIIERNFEVKPLGEEEVDILEASGRVLSEDIYSILNLPPYDRSKMDGYAVRAEDTYGADYDNPIELNVIGSAKPGKMPKIEVSKGSAVEISTGAPIPKGANAVVMVEYTERKGDKVEIYRPVAIGENIVFSGSDLNIGERILRKGEILTRREIGVLAAIGVRKVKVYRRPRVAIISTGDELEKPGLKLEDYKVYDVNSYSLYAAVSEIGGEPLKPIMIRDREEDIRKSLEEAVEKADIILISGGTSAGVGDIVYRVIEKLGKPGIIIHGLKIKPGKPTIVAKVKGKPIIGLPGWPVSALMIFKIIVEPIIKRMLGKKINEEEAIKVPIARRIIPSKGRVNLIPVSLIRGEGDELRAYPLIAHSGAIATLKRADGYAIIGEKREIVYEGEVIPIRLFTEDLKIPDLTIIGSHCPALEKIVEIFEETNNFKVRIIAAGSMAGLISIKNGEADIAGIHLLDEDSLTYNVPYLAKFNIEGAVLVKGYRRRQGIMLRKDCKDKVENFKDILKSGLRFINRNRGSGTRILIENLIKKVSEEMGISMEEARKMLKGYNLEVKTHASVATAIKMGRADVGVGVEFIAKQYGLEFIPLKEEEYDFLVKRRSLKREAVRKFIEMLKSEEVRKLLNEMGMKPSKEIGNIIWPLSR